MVGPMMRQNLAGIAARHALEFALGHALGIANHAALGAAEGNIHGRRLPGHPGGERFHFVERDVGMDNGCRPCRDRATTLCCTR